jgi:phenylpyruvate tautomerase PptA (4-oxalocrotonate tautomerase family)
MRLWHIYYPENAYSAEDKCALATRITDLYADVGLPRFYASVVFHELPKNSFFVGGKATNDFVRIWIDRIARVTAPERRAWWLERVNTTLNPFVRERGYRWEVHIDETPIDFWTIKRTARRHILECGPNLQRADRGDGYHNNLAKEARDGEHNNRAKTYR